MNQNELGKNTMSDNEIYLPENGELVIGTVVRVVHYGAYATLDEYNDVEGLLHISEVSSSWVKNIREHVREGQKTVLKVLRVDHAKLHVDLSLRQVSDRERREKLLHWKQENRGKQLLNLAAEKMKITHEEAYEKIGKLIENTYGNIYLGLEKAVEIGQQALDKSGIPSDWANTLTELAVSNIKISHVKIRGNLELTSTKPNGVDILKGVFAKAIGIKKPQGSSIKLYTIGAPRYRIEITAEDYKQAEKLLDRVVQRTLKFIKSEGGEGKFSRGIAKEA
jgi:translation initiation factor 2 subunit 1